MVQGRKEIEKQIMIHNFNILFCFVTTWNLFQGLVTLIITGRREKNFSI